MALTKTIANTSLAPDGSTYVTFTDGAGNLNPLSGFSYAHGAGAGNIFAKASPGVLHSININTAATTVTIYDNTSATGTIIAIIGALTGTFTYDVSFVTGLTVAVVGSGDVTVSYR